MQYSHLIFFTLLAALWGCKHEAASLPTEPMPEAPAEMTCFTADNPLIIPVPDSCQLQEGPPDPNVGYDFYTGAKYCYSYVSHNPNNPNEILYWRFELLDSLRNEGKTELWCLDLCSGNKRLVTDQFSHALWGKNGWLISNKGYRIYKFKPDGSQVTEVSSNPNLDYYWPQWSPDGTKILYAEHDRNNPPIKMTIADENGNILKQYPFTFMNNIWSPSGRYIGGNFEYQNTVIDWQTGDTLLTYDRPLEAVSKLASPCRWHPDEKHILELGHPLPHPIQKLNLYTGAHSLICAMPCLNQSFFPAEYSRDGKYIYGEYSYRERVDYYKLLFTTKVGIIDVEKGVLRVIDIKD